jgi:glutaryl-CoA dehydrogenase
MALRIVQNVLITFSHCEVPETNRLQQAESFKDTAQGLRMTRAGVAWQAVGCASGAYESVLRYTNERKQFETYHQQFSNGAGPLGDDAQ